MKNNWITSTWFLEGSHLNSTVIHQHSFGYTQDGWKTSKPSFKQVLPCNFFPSFARAHPSCRLLLSLLQLFFYFLWKVKWIVPKRELNQMKESSITLASSHTPTYKVTTKQKTSWNQSPSSMRDNNNHRPTHLKSFSLRLFLHQNPEKCPLTFSKLSL